MANKQTLHELLLNKEFILLDGAMGTMLQNSGLKLGEIPETLCFSNEDAILAVHKMYVDAGSDIIYANTFGANEKKLAHASYSVEEIITKAISIAKRAAEEKALVALDIGPIGEMLEPNGALTFEEAYEIFRRQLIAGEKAGADLVVFETMTDLYEVKAAVLAAKENISLPIFVTMTFEENKRTFTGCSIAAMAALLNGLGVDAMGINCSLGPDEIFPMALELSTKTELPIIIKANAGLPNLITNSYDITPELFGESMNQYVDIGVKIMGGCCGTTPAYIEQIKNTLEGKTCVPRTATRESVVCTPTDTVYINQVKVIGERINPTGKKRFQQALKENDLDYIIAQGIEQADAGADILDVNVGLPKIDEPAMMKMVVKSLQSVISLPLQIDSSDPAAIEAGLRVYNGKPIVNSVNGKDEILDTILPIVKKYGASVVGLTLDERGIPKTAQERLAIAQKILDRAQSYGIPKEDVFIDCLTLTVSAEPGSADVTLEAVSAVKKTLGLKTVLGVSNISFGLPSRGLINRTFLTLAMGAGLDLPIINPNNRDIAESVAAFRVLKGTDQNAAAFIERYANQDSSASANDSKETEHDISYTILKGLKEETKKKAKQMLIEEEPLVLVNQFLIPALDRVGELFEVGKIFLPQLLSAAEAASSAFDVVKDALLKSGNNAPVKNKIILATVKGDIHDIGKNIVKVILENYGYRVIDLGKDVPIETVVETAIKEDVKLIGLSALMTTTLKSMEETISALRKSGHKCHVLVGGAVLTEDYAKMIGADFYAKDAKQSADIAKKVLG